MNIKKNKEFKTFKLAVILFVITIILAICYGLSPIARFGGQLAGKPVKVAVMPVGTINKPVPILGTGSIESPKSIPITAEFTGLISELYVAEGQSVKAGQPLFKIRGVVVEPSTSSAITTPVSKAPASNPLVKSGYEDALREYNRDQKLYEQGAIPKRQLDNSAARLQALQGGAAAAVPDATPPKANPAATLSNAPPVAVNSLATINAPISGKVVKLVASVGTTVQSRQQLMVVDSGEVQVIIPIEEKDLSQVHLGTPVTIEAGGQNLLGQVASVYPEMGTNNVPVFSTHIKVTNDTAGLLKIGMSVNVRVNTGKIAIVRAVAKEAVVIDSQGKKYIYLADNGKALRQEVSTGETIGGLVEITSTLPEQAIAITSNVNDLRDGYNIEVEE